MGKNQDGKTKSVKNQDGKTKSVKNKDGQKQGQAKRRSEKKVGQKHFVVFADQKIVQKWPCEEVDRSLSFPE